jgi:putative ABC transport system permease protein
MFQNNVKIAFRSLWKNKGSTIINLFGLTAGLSSCLLIALFIKHELSFDKFQDKGSRIARVIMEYSFDGSPDSKKGNFTSTKVAPVFSRTFPEVEAAVRMDDRTTIVKYDDNLLNEKRFMFVDSSFFKVFQNTILSGNPENALNGPFKVVLSESTARRYFKNADPLGKTLLIGSDATPYEITGVIKDYPAESQVAFDFLASFSSLKQNQERSYFDANYTTYLLLKDKTAFSSLQNKITSFMKKEMAGSGASVNFHLEPFNEIHLYSEYDSFVPNTSMRYLYTLSAVALLILVIVCFTYINMSTARSVERAREVGIRKVVGGARSQLFVQFMGESFVVCSIAVILSINMAILLLPYFNVLTEKQLSFQQIISPGFILFSILLTVSVSLLAGSYPALVLSSFQPIRVLKGIFRNSSSGKFIQPVLIVFQFAISVFLIIATVIIQKQLHFIQNKKLGYERDHVLVLPMNNKMLENLPVIKRELKTNHNILSVSRCVSTPVNIMGGYTMRSGLMPENEFVSVTANPVDEDYITTTGLEVIAGNDLTDQDIKDASTRIYHFILNESAAKQLGWTAEEAIGKTMSLDNSRPGTVRGVVKDFHFESMHSAIKPLVLFPEERGHGQVLVKITGQNLSETITFIESKWKQHVPYMPFEYRFMNDDYNKLYAAELTLGKVMKIFAGVAIVLACIGLFGLSSYVVQQRIKEIGIRKIFGASLLNIVNLLSGRFAKFVLVSILIASPLAYFLMNNWLQDFAYQIEIQWPVFVWSGVIAIGIALLTVSIQSIRAALMSPAKSLKAE